MEADRAAVMRALTSRFDETSSELVSGLRVFTGKGRVTVSPMRQKNALYVLADGQDAETARELCGQIGRMIRDAGGTLPDSFKKNGKSS